MTFRFSVVATPLGDATAVFSPEGLAALSLSAADPHRAIAPLVPRLGAVPMHDETAGARLAAELEAYFGGRSARIGVPLDWRLTRGFARDALQSVCEIPYGETAGYGEVAMMAGRPGAARAVGTACRTTPFSLVVPVHRVVRADGSLGEYGARPEAKRFLVELERSHRDRLAASSGGAA